MTDHERLKKVETIRARIFIKEPFLGYILQKIPIILLDTCDTAATNGTEIIINRDFLDGLDDDGITFLLLHELMHIILKHVTRRKNRDPVRYNIAADIVTNDILRFYGFPYGHLKPIFGDAYDLDGYLNTTEAIYDALPESIELRTLDEHGLWPDFDNGTMNQSIDNMIKEAVKRGYKPGNFDMINDVVNQLNDSKTATKWRNMLKKYVTKNLMDYTFDRTDKRYGDVLMPAFTENINALENIWFVIDASGSMHGDIDVAYNELRKIISTYKSINCKVSFFSNIVTPPVELNRVTDVKHSFSRYQTTFGTSFDIIFKRIPDFFRHSLPKAIIIMTDGYAEFPDKRSARNIPVVWCITNDSVHPPFGGVMRI